MDTQLVSRAALLILCLVTPGAAQIRCYTCTYTFSGTDGSYNRECVTSPVNHTLTSQVDCPEGKLCTVKVTYDPGFICYRCSFNLDTPSAEGQACLESPAAMAESWRVPCGNYCVTEEVYNKRLERVTSLFRSCGKGWGTGCTHSQELITCRVSCLGDFCSQSLTGSFYTHMQGYGPPTGDSDNNHLGTSNRGRSLSTSLTLLVVAILFQCLASARTLSVVSACF